MNESWRDTLKLAAVGAGALLAARAVYRRMSEYDLAGKTVLITGGSRGLGLVLARGFADEGASIAICARDPRELERARADLGARGARVLAFPCDVTDRAQVRELIEVVTRHFGRVDVLVNNAGIIQVGPLESMTLEDFEQAMATHFWGPLYATLAVLPQMRARREGRIVNVSSVGGKISVPHLVPYSASKFALAGLSDGMRAELAKDGVTVTSVFPGLMRTGSPRNATFKGQHRAEYAWFAISDSLPVSSIKAERAASQIIKACKRGQAELVITTQALAAVKFRALFPEATADILAVANRLLPGPGGIGRARARGRESESALAPSILTTLSEWAARHNNEVAEG
jgi:NAD(P)-dependent dehydrogenase (short-subunit alcohol dehydrogenase family)